MTTEQRKEELIKVFFEQYCERNASGNVTVSSRPQDLFDFFYSEIEARDKRAELYEYEVEALKRVVREYEAERRRLEEIIKAADEVIYRAQYLSGYSTHASFRIKFSEALEHYNKLKSKTE